MTKLNAQEFERDIFPTRISTGMPPEMPRVDPRETYFKELHDMVARAEIDDRPDLTMASVDRTMRITGDIELGENAIIATRAKVNDTRRGAELHVTSEIKRCDGETVLAIIESSYGP